jgi:hypothetical protein
MYKYYSIIMLLLFSFFVAGCATRGASLESQGSDYAYDDVGVDGQAEDYPDDSTGCIAGDCTNGIGTYIWESGDRYDGGWSNGLCHGQGTYYYSSDGSRFTGQWVNHNRVGKGTLWFANGDIYEGEFKRNVPCGTGIYTYADGTVENGEFLQYMFVGVIKLPGFKDSDRVEVSRVTEVKAAQGEVVITGSELNMGDRLFVEVDGIMAVLEVISPMMTVARCKMIGQTKAFIFKVKKGQPVYRLMAGIQKGSNEFLFPNGNRYVGQYKGNLMHGEGEFYWTNGNVYRGEFKNGVRHGKGVINFYYNCTYDGDWKFGKFEGRGKYTWADGSNYDGDWKDGWKNGKGTYTWADGGKYIGDWADDLMAGYGVYYYPNGDRYEGEWLDDYFNGKGVMYDAEGNVKQQGRWLNGNYIGN